MERLFWICLAGAAGTGTRYLVAVWAAQRFGTAFPFGTLIVNLAGCFLIALLMHTVFALSWSPVVRSALTVGFLGGLTTYSSFNYETSSLLEAGATAPALANAGATLFGGFVAGWLGVIVSRQLFGH
jgi:fluoride exporter